jgi:hypothetical protein
MFKLWIFCRYYGRLFNAVLNLVFDVVLILFVQLGVGFSPGIIKRFTVGEALEYLFCLLSPVGLQSALCGFLHFDWIMVVYCQGD